MTQAKEKVQVPVNLYKPANPYIGKCISTEELSASAPQTALPKQMAKSHQKQGYRVRNLEKKLSP